MCPGSSFDTVIMCLDNVISRLNSHLSINHTDVHQRIQLGWSERGKLDRWSDANFDFWDLLMTFTWALTEAVFIHLELFNQVIKKGHQADAWFWGLIRKIREYNNSGTNILLINNQKWINTHFVCYTYCINLYFVCLSRLIINIVTDRELGMT